MPGQAAGTRAAVGPAAQELLVDRPSGPGRRPRTACSIWLLRSSWGADAVRDNVVGQLHDDWTVLVVDKSGDGKKGTHTVGVGANTQARPGRSKPSR